MKKIFEKPILRVIVLSEQDVLASTGSGQGEVGSDGPPWTDPF